MNNIYQLPRKSLDVRFAEYHRDNPHIYILLQQFADQAKSAGLKTYSVRSIFHVIRWHVNVTTKTKDGFKMNNDYTSRYARMLMEEFPRFKDFFETRELKS